MICATGSYCTTWHHHTGFDSILLDLAQLRGARLCHVCSLAASTRCWGASPGPSLVFPHPCPWESPDLGAALLTRSPQCPPPAPGPCSSYRGCWGCPQAQGTWGFSLAKPACQGSWVINISLHTQPDIFLAWGRAAEAFPQLFQRTAPLQGARSDWARQVQHPMDKPTGQAQGCARLSSALPVSRAQLRRASTTIPARLPHGDSFTRWGDSTERNWAAAFAF